MTTRPFRDEDAAAVIALMGADPRTLSSPTNRLHVAEEAGAIIGAVVWEAPSAGDVAHLGTVTTPARRRDIFYQLVRACAVDALGQGFTQATFTILNRQLLALLQRDFTITAEASAWNPKTHRPAHWQVTVDLNDALRQLARVT